jgi:hypothetical protein
MSWLFSSPRARTSRAHFKLCGRDARAPRFGIRGYPKTRIHEVGQRACARWIDGGRARASALTYEDDGFRIAATVNLL